MSGWKHAGTGVAPTGAVFDFAGAASKCPDGYLICGQNVSRTTYAALFAVIGTTWGAGDGTTTFTLPPNGRAYVGLNTETEFNAIGKTGGAKTHTLTEAQMPNHRHGMDQGGLGGGGGARAQCTTNDTNYGLNTQYTGGGQAHNNLPPYAVVLKIIKY